MGKEIDENDIVFPNYFSVIPANVRYDKRLNSSQKLFYGEITALSNKYGYCWASNDYFAKLYHVKRNTITNWVKKLKAFGYVTVEHQYIKGTKAISKRIIKLNEVVNKLNTGGQFNNEGWSINHKDNNKNNNTSRIISPSNNYSEEELKELYDN